MAPTKEASVEIKGYPYTFSRRFEKSDYPRWRGQDYVSFAVVSDEKDGPEILFNQDSEMIKRLKDEYPNEIFATGTVSWRPLDKEIDEISLHARPESTVIERKVWAERTLERINSQTLNERVWITINHYTREFYIYHRPHDWYLKRPKPQIFPVFSAY